MCFNDYNKAKERKVVSIIAQGSPAPRSLVPVQPIPLLLVATREQTLHQFLPEEVLDPAFATAFAFLGAQKQVRPTSRVENNVERCS